MNKELAIQKKLIIDNNDSLYKNIENTYKYLFELYLSSKINLKKYDDEIKNSPYYFGKPNPNEKQLLSNIKEYFGLNYIFLLNNFFIEKLDENDIKLIINYINSKNYSNNEEMLKLIERTYREVIKNNYRNGEYTNQQYKVCYGPAIPNNFALNSAVVLKIFYGKNTKELTGQEFIDNMKNQREFLDRIIIEIKNDFQNTLQIPCEIITEKISN